MIISQYKHTEINLNDYVNAHVHKSCTGQFELIRVQKMPLNMDSLGCVLVPNIPMLSCHKCEATYMLPNFEDFIAKSLAITLLLSSCALSPREIRFLRLVTDTTQQDIADFIDCDRAYYAKCESEKSPTHRLSLGRQKLLKIFHATKLNVSGLVEETVRNIDHLKDETISREDLNYGLTKGFDNLDVKLLRA